MKRLAAHQCNLCPWSPFFKKMEAVDVFVILTHCQFNREHYQHRFSYKSKWFSLGVKDIKHKDLIRNKTYANPLKDWDKIKRRLPEFKTWFSQFDDYIHPSLCGTNCAIILRIASMLHIKTKIVLDTYTELTATDRLVELCKLFGADTYLAGRSGSNYMEMDKFEKAGIKVEFQTVTDTRHVFEL